MNAPADQPERIADILREILALSGNKEISLASPAEASEGWESDGPDSDVEDAKSKSPRPTLNG